MTDVVVSELFRDFLLHADSIAAGVPDSTTLKKQALSDTKLAKPPRLIVNVAKDDENKRPGKIVFLATVVITTELLIDVRATVEGWMTKVRERIESGEDYPFQNLEAWIQANRTEQQRTGWQIEKLRVLVTEEDEAFEDDTKTFNLSLPMRLTVRLR